ncbi:hypothetical protein DI392_08720 [Vibrio albus]|uniref:Uncharacterized protein n=1 Tax=Vibrio albus TaxID=2200953 RepID=A0A2U3B9T3_9VIBR|nr:hypothetical protein [Vibrio albus]PWI33541.1 hypothetical protein DI392_08720 [Vibrio albus]
MKTLFIFSFALIATSSFASTNGSYFKVTNSGEHYNWANKRSERFVKAEKFGDTLDEAATKAFKSYGDSIMYPQDGDVGKYIGTVEKRNGKTAYLLDMYGQLTLIGINGLKQSSSFEYEFLVKQQENKLTSKEVTHGVVLGKTKIAELNGDIVFSTTNKRAQVKKLDSTYKEAPCFHAHCPSASYAGFFDGKLANLTFTYKTKSSDKFHYTLENALETKFRRRGSLIDWSKNRESTGFWINPLRFAYVSYIDSSDGYSEVTYELNATDLFNDFIQLLEKDKQSKRKN